VNYPGELDAGVARWLEGQGSVVEATAELTSAYRAGKTSTGLDLGAYVVSRVPATFAANTRVHAALQDAWPGFSPQTLLDIGAGPGTASWAACAWWTGIQSVIQCEQDPKFAAVAATLNEQSGVAPLQTAKLYRSSEVALAPDLAADLVVASYMLAELPLAQIGAVTKRLWARSQQALVLIEPGTPQGFERLRVARMTLLAQGAFVIAPCTHQNSCPMSGTNWCHFKTRVQRSRAHLHAKQGHVPFEDEAFSYLVMARIVAPQLGGRIVAPPRNNKVATVLPLCDENGLHDEVIASRGRPAYKRAKKAKWGDWWT
jgi:ribosomal protein RSM22 (predicted rRNA methylase)